MHQLQWWSAYFSASIEFCSTSAGASRSARALRCTHDTDDDFNLNAMALQMYSSYSSSAMSCVQYAEQGNDATEAHLHPQAGHKLLCSTVPPVPFGAPVHNAAQTPTVIMAKIELHRDGTPDVFPQPKSLDESSTSPTATDSARRW